MFRPLKKTAQKYHADNGFHHSYNRLTRNMYTVMPGFQDKFSAIEEYYVYFEVIYFKLDKRYSYN